jgi:hypothetical protein
MNQKKSNNHPQSKSTCRQCLLLLKAQVALLEMQLAGKNRALFLTIGLLLKPNRGVLWLLWSNIGRATPVASVKDGTYRATVSAIGGNLSNTSWFEGWVLNYG